MDNLKESITSAKSISQKGEILADFLANQFNVNKEDIAILFEKVGALSFIWPFTLNNCAVPIDEKSTAGKTYCQKKTFIFNKFVEVAHVSLFEKFVKDENQKSLPIQKIISTPITINGEVKGVLQISRKGASPSECRDFVKEDGIKVLEVLKEVGSLFQ